MGLPPSDGSIRLCVDMTEPNKAIKIVHHIMPTIEDIKYRVNGAKIFSKVDLKNGYHQLEPEESSRDITTFTTHLGLYRYCRLNFGTNSAAEIFHKEISQRIQNIEGALSIHDDILIYGKNQVEHDKAVKNVLRMMEQYDLTINAAKFEFNSRSINFFGLVFSESGVSPDPEKIKALKQAEPPETKSELRSFLGMLNFSAGFINDFSGYTSELRRRTHKNSQWEWTKNHQEAFEKLKNALSEHTILSYFQPKWKREIICDGSLVGVSAIRIQIKPQVKRKLLVMQVVRLLMLKLVTGKLKEKSLQCISHA